MIIKLLILDVDGVLTDGTKFYNEQHQVLGKRFLCKDFTALKRFAATGIKVVFLSGDNFNRSMAKKRNVDFYCSRGEDLSLDKSRFLPLFEQKYNTPSSQMAFVGDDYFDLSMFKSLKQTFCPADAPKIIKENASVVLNSPGGTGVIVELYDYFVQNTNLKEASEKEVADLDKKETSSREMK